MYLAYPKYLINIYMGEGGKSHSTSKGNSLILKCSFKWKGSFINCPKQSPELPETLISTQRAWDVCSAVPPAPGWALQTDWKDVLKWHSYQIPSHICYPEPSGRDVINSRTPATANKTEESSPGIPGWKVCCDELYRRISRVVCAWNPGLCLWGG